jgi:group I intron endonuclease
LQNAWNKYGSDSFEFIVLVECDKDDLNVREEIEVGKFEKCMVYNISEDFTSRTGKLNPFFGRSHSSESKEKMSKWKKTHYVGKGNPNFGGKNSCVLQELMRGSNNCNAKLSEDDVRKIKMRLTNKEKHQQIADDFNVSRSVITRINNGTRWGHINKGE